MSGFYHSGCQYLHHSLWSPPTEAKQLKKTQRYTHKYSLHFSRSHTFFMLNLFLTHKQVFSLLLCCAVVCYRHLCSQHVFRPLLPWPGLHNPRPDLQTHWPLQALWEISNRKRLTKKSNYCSFTRKTLSCTQRKQRKREKHQQWQRGLELNNTTFVTSGQTGKWRQLCSETCDLTLSVSLLNDSDPERWPDTNAHTEKHTHTHTCWQQNMLPFLIASDDVGGRCHG